MRHARAQPLAMKARCESALRGSTARCSASRSVAALESVVLVAGALGKQRAEGVDVGRNVLRAQARGQAAIEESGGGVKRPVEAVRIRVERLVFGREMRPEIDDVEASLGRSSSVTSSGLTCINW